MTKRCPSVPLSVIFLVALTALSCSSGIFGDGSATLVLSLAAPDTARGPGVPWPIGGMPVFSSLSASVSGPGMETITQSFDPSSASIQVRVPAGYDRRVSVTAVPDWSATGIRYDTGMLPYGVKAYGGATAPFAASAGRTIQASLYLGVTGSRLLVPTSNYDGSMVWLSLALADGLSATPAGAVPVALSPDMFYEYDRFGRLYVSGNSYIDVFLDPENDPVASLSFDGETAIRDIAWSFSDDRLYGMTVAGDLFWRDTANYDASPNATTVFSPNGGDSFGFEQGGVAVDSKGFVYVIAMEYATEDQVLLKLSVGPALDFTAASTVVAYRSLASLGIDFPYAVQDMAMADGVLYLAARDSYAYAYMTGADSRSRGLVAAVSADSLNLLWTAGSTGGGNRPSDPASQFFGPMRFVAVAPKKLYVIDDGFSWSGTWGEYLADVDRIVELDISNGALSGSGLSGISAFFQDFSDIQAY